MPPPGNVKRLPGTMTELEIALRDGWLEFQGKLLVHGPKRCAGAPCPLHNPSPHHMTNWPIVIRLDLGGLTERICPEGIGHPDPDSLGWLRSMRMASGSHSCDGCCQPS